MSVPPDLSPSKAKQRRDGDRKKTTLGQILYRNAPPPRVFQAKGKMHRCNPSEEERYIPFFIAPPPHFSLAESRWIEVSTTTVSEPR